DLPGARGRAHQGSPKQYSYRCFLHASSAAIIASPEPIAARFRCKQLEADVEKGAGRNAHQFRGEAVVALANQRLAHGTECPAMGHLFPRRRIRAFLKSPEPHMTV